MIVITEKKSNIVVEIANQCIEDGEKMLVKPINGGEYYFASVDDLIVHRDVVDAKNYAVRKWCYNPENGFFKNEDYISYVSPEEKVKELETELLNTKLAMAELVEQQQADKLNNQLALAELIESIMEGGTVA